MIQLDQLPTEQQNPNTACIDRLSTLDMVRVINDEDKKVAFAVEKELVSIAAAVDAIYEALKAGGRLIYCGCGTSGRLGILDAVECPPTFSTDPEMVQGVIAGGEPALFCAAEGAEDMEPPEPRHRFRKVYGNLMVDVKPTNEKLVRRAIRIVATAAHTDEDEARAALEQCGFSAKTAIVMLVKHLPAAEAERRLEETGGIVARALDEEE